MRPYLSDMMYCTVRTVQYSTVQYGTVLLLDREVISSEPRGMPFVYTVLK